MIRNNKSESQLQEQKKDIKNSVFFFFYLFVFP